MTGVFNSPGKSPLVFGTGPGGSAGENFPPVRDIAAQSGYIFVINLLHFFGAKATNFPSWFPHSLLSNAFSGPGRVRFRRLLRIDSPFFKPFPLLVSEGVFRLVGYHIQGDVWFREDFGLW